LNSAATSDVSLPVQITSVDSGVACIRIFKRELGAPGGLVDMKAPVLQGMAVKILVHAPARTSHAETCLFGHLEW
jgi:hypothetical protein